MNKAVLLLFIALSCAASESVCLDYGQYIAVESAIAAIKNTDQYQKKKWSLAVYKIKIEQSSFGYTIWFTPCHPSGISSKDGFITIRQGSSYDDEYPALVVQYDLKEKTVSGVNIQK